MTNNKKNLLEKLVAAGACWAVLLAGLMLTSGPGKAEKDDGGGDEAAKIQVGLREAPVPLNLAGKNRSLVGLGSYLVNVSQECNGCHSAGPATEYTGNPYLFVPPSQTVRQTKKVNPATYLGGGRDFGPFPAPNSPLHIYSRNLTPDVTGKPLGGDSFEEFREILRTGVDFDHLHSTCAANTPQTASCVPYPFDGSRLMIMPWPAYQDMTERDMRAVYEYLSAIPCIDTVVAGQPQLRHNCPAH